jgi:hypothetical protein
MQTQTEGGLRFRGPPCTTALTIIRTTRFNMKKKLYSAHTVYLYVSYDAHGKQRLFP